MAGVGAATMIEEAGVQEKKMYQIFFISDNEDQTVNVAEMEDIDVAEIRIHLRAGGSVFITTKRTPRVGRIRALRKLARDDSERPHRPVYFAHV